MMFYEKNATSVYNIIARAVYAVHIVRTCICGIDE